MATPLNLLFVEDMRNDADLLPGELRRAGFDSQRKRVQTEPDFLAEIKKLPDFIISDYLMPAFIGMQAAKILRASGLDSPFILISGTVGEDIAVEAMKHVATDYLLKDRSARLGTDIQQGLEQKRLRIAREQTEQNLRESEVFIEDVINSLTAHVVVLDAQGIIIEVNNPWGNFIEANEASNGIQALDVWQANRLEIRLLLTDLVMPDEMNGIELAETLVQKNSQLKVIYTSGYSADVTGEGLPLNEGINFHAKPYESQKFARTVRDCLDQN